MSTGEHPPTVVSFGEDVLDRMVWAGQRVGERLERSTAALEQATITYALGGSNATAAWISLVDQSAVRQARNVELILLRCDFEAVKSALEENGFVAMIRKGEVRFLDGLEGKWRDAIEITFAGEPVLGASSDFVTPQPDENETISRQRILRLPSLIKHQLARFRLDDSVDLRDMIEVGLVDHSWLDRLPPPLAARLQELLDNPDG